LATVSSLFVYPIKSCQGLSLTSLVCGERGPLNDRRWMVIDDRGRFVSQRENPRLSLIAPFFYGDQLVATAPGAASLRLDDRKTTRCRVSVWNFEGEAEDLGEECARWFTEILEQSCRVVRFADDVHRAVSKSHTALNAEVAFSDGYPLLLVSLESWSELNRHLEVPVPMSRFRPNVVLRGCQPFQEDEWQTLAVPQLTLDLVKPCERCKITTLNPDTLEYGIEPLATLAKFRRGPKGVLFGQNAVHHGPGVIEVGDNVTVLAERTSLNPKQPEPVPPTPAAKT
jgi:uncharacterized protein